MNENLNTNSKAKQLLLKIEEASTALDKDYIKKAKKELIKTFSKIDNPTLKIEITYNARTDGSEQVRLAKKFNKEMQKLLSKVSILEILFEEVKRK